MKRTVMTIVLAAILATMMAPVAGAFLGPNDCDMAEYYGWMSPEWNNACITAMIMDGWDDFNIPSP